MHRKGVVLRLKIGIGIGSLADGCMIAFSGSFSGRETYHTRCDSLCGPPLPCPEMGCLRQRDWGGRVRRERMLTLPIHIRVTALKNVLGLSRIKRGCIQCRLLQGSNCSRSCDGGPATRLAWKRHPKAWHLRARTTVLAVHVLSISQVMVESIIADLCANAKSTRSSGHLVAYDLLTSILVFPRG